MQYREENRKIDKTKKTLDCKAGLPNITFVSFPNSEHKNVKFNNQFQVILWTSNFHYSTIEEGHLSR